MTIARIFAVTMVAGSALAQTTHPPAITSITVCSATGTGGAGSCPSGTFDTHQIVLAPDGSGNPINQYGGVKGVSDEHQSIFSPGTLNGNSDYLFFVATSSKLTADTGVVVLTGGSGPGKNGQWTMDFASADGYDSYAAGYGQIFLSPAGPNCPTVADGNPAHQDQTFDLNYASPGSIVADPTSAAGNMLMVYEGTSTCIGTTGGAPTGNFFSSVAIATSNDYGHTWPAYRAKAGYNFPQLPALNTTQGPDAPLGALGSGVCMGNNCTTTTPATYGRYAVLTPSVSFATAMATGQPLPSSMGDSEMSGFLDDASANPARYLYSIYNYNPGSSVLADPKAPNNVLTMARAQLNGATAPLSFLKWNGQAFAATGLGGYDSAILPSGAFAYTGATSTTNTVSVMIGGVPVPQANVVFSGLVGAGLYQLNIVVPSNLGSGDKALVATVGGAETQSGVLLSLQ